MFGFSGLLFERDTESCVKETGADTRMNVCCCSVCCVVGSCNFVCVLAFLRGAIARFPEL